MVFQCINIRQVPREVLKTAASSLGFQHLPRDLANVNAWKIMFDPYIDAYPAIFWFHFWIMSYCTCRRLVTRFPGYGIANIFFLFNPCPAE